MGKDVNTIKVFINLVYRKPRVTRGDSHHLPERQGGYLDKKGDIARKVNYYLDLSIQQGEVESLSQFLYIFRGQKINNHEF